MNYKVENTLTDVKLKLKHIDENEYEKLYKEIESKEIASIFSKLHSQYIYLFRLMNQRLPSGNETPHYWANESRSLLYFIDITYELKRKLENTTYSFNIEKEYKEIIEICNNFLTSNGGSAISSHMEKIELYYEQPIFILNDNVNLTRKTGEITYGKITAIGEGSYAKVFKYKDPIYNKYFVIKRANKNLETKEFSRFKKEFDVLKKYSSPYIVEAYSYNSNKNEYTMEFMDLDLNKFIKLNPELSIKERKIIGLQIIKGLEYVHSKGDYHRDLSIKNVLIKIYESTYIVKLCDFNLVKEINSTLTSDGSLLKGSLNDPSLAQIGFNNYELCHEIYALTLLLNYVITGKENSLNTNDMTEKFVEKGTHANKEKRFKNLDEIRNEFKKL